MYILIFFLSQNLILGSADSNSEAEFLDHLDVVFEKTLFFAEKK
jgi:hypothetical protein